MRLCDSLIRSHNPLMYPSMNRRNFGLASGLPMLLPLLTGLTPITASAANEPQAGKDYTVLAKPVAPALAGKVEVIEFFGYWCPHCNHLEPKLQAWIKTLPPTVNFRRVPVSWSPAHAPLQKLYFALEQMGVPEAVHAKVFSGLHVDRKPAASDADVIALGQAAGADKDKLTQAMASFTVANKVRQAQTSTPAYQIEGVPTLVVDGKYLTSPELAKGEDQALAVVSALIKQSRAAR